VLRRRVCPDEALENAALRRSDDNMTLGVCHPSSARTGV
jgi:hypothetical protein